MKEHSPILKQYANLEYNGDYNSFMTGVRNVELNSSLRTDYLHQHNGKIRLESFDGNVNPGQYTIVVDEVEFNCFYKQGSDKFLYVFLSGAAINPAIFQRWSWNPHGSTLAIADPMTTVHNLNLGWYYGTKDKDYRNLCSKIIKHIANNLDVNYSNIILYGSSGGGTSAIHISRYVEGCVVVAINPQIDIHSLQKSVDNIEKIMGLKIDDSELIYRNNVRDVINRGMNRYVLMVNCLSKDDFIPIANLNWEMNHKIKFGLSSCENVCTWVYKAKPIIASSGDWATHNSQDYLYLFELIDYLIRNNIFFSKHDDELLIAITKMWQDRFDLFNELLKYKTIVESRHDPKAQFRLAKMYKDGDHVPKDEILYNYWIDISSENNYLSKKEKKLLGINTDYNNLSKQLFEKALEHIKNKKDVNVAMQLLRDADYFGHRWAKTELVKLLWEMNTAESLYEYYLICKEEVQRNNTDFEIYLARAYRDGKGVDSNSDLTIKYYRLAIVHNIYWANCEMFDYVRSQKMVDLYPEIIEYAEKRAAEGDAHMIARLALAYNSGLGVTINHEKAYGLMKYAAKEGVVWAKNELLKMENEWGERSLE